MAGEVLKIEQRPESSIDVMMRFAESAVRSKFYGFQSADQLLPLMMIAQSQGRPFVSVIEEYCVISNRPALKSEAMLARFQRAGGHIKWTALGDDRVAAVFSHAQCDPVEVDWDMDRARQAGLAGRGPWKSYPRQMLKARVISDGVRTCFPACLGGMYTPEEEQDISSRQIEYRPAPHALEAPREEDARQFEHERATPGNSAGSVARELTRAIEAGEEDGLDLPDPEADPLWDELVESLSECSCIAEAEEWRKAQWRKGMPIAEKHATFRKAFKERVFLPYIANLPEVPF